LVALSCPVASHRVQQELEEYEFCTFFNKKEILHVHNVFERLKVRDWMWCDGVVVWAAGCAKNNMWALAVEFRSSLFAMAWV
jgi:hypothetical protein